jgi:hypothetical protein
VYLMSIFSLTTNRYQRHIIVWCLIYINTVWNLQSKNNVKVDFSSVAILHWPFSSVIDRNRNRPFNLIQNKVGYRSYLATEVKLEQCLWNSFDVNSNLEVIYCRPDCALSPTWFFSNPRWNIICYYTKVYFNSIPTFHKKYRKQNKQLTRKLVRQIILEINSLDM